MSLLTDDMRAAIGREVTYTAPEELGRASIRYFARAVGDNNRLYTDDEFARQHGYRGVIAPPTLIFETNQYADVARDEDGYAGHGWHLDLPGTRMVRGGNRYTFHQAVGPDDILHVTWRIADITERSNRAGQDMLIVSSQAAYRNQHGDLLAENEETIIFIALNGAS